MTSVADPNEGKICIWVFSSRFKWGRVIVKLYKGNLASFDNDLMEISELQFSFISQFFVDGCFC